MKVAVVHDWFVSYAGAERVIAQILQCYPQAAVFSVVDFLPESDREFLADKPVTTSFIQRLPLARRHYRKYLPLMPLAVEQFDLSGFDLIISSSHAVAKGVITGPDQLHISYVHTPMRYAWDLQHTYLANQSKGLTSTLMRVLLSRLRVWDYASAQRPDILIANSHYIARRIRKVWRREASVIYPPVATHLFTPGGARGEIYLCACRLVPYKRVDLVVAAFARMPEKQLVIIGDGPELLTLKSQATANIKFLGWQTNEQICDYLRHAKAFVFAGEEDFGILPVEAQACGAPVIAYGRGGLSETVNNWDMPQASGVHFYEQTAESVCQAVRLFETKNHTLLVSNSVNNASRFSESRFRQELTELVNSAMSLHAKG